MATYKKGFKKQTPEQMLLKVIVGIIVTVFLIVLVAFIYDLATPTFEYDDFTHIKKYEEVLTQKDEQSVQLEDYVVYFYYDDCTACSSIKSDALKIVNKLNKDSDFVILANTTEMEDADTYKDTFLEDIAETQLLTPTLLVVANGEYHEVQVGAEDVLETLESIKAGTYLPFND